MKLYNLFGCVLLAACVANDAMATDYTSGIIVVNEGQYGKSNGSLNYLMPDDATDYWQYKVFRAENPGRELGCTPSFGAYFDNRLYIVSKQDKDPSATVGGGILTVADATSLKWIGQLDEIDPSGARASGRAFVGVSANKGYVSTSNGIWIVNLQALTVTEQIAGTENPNGVDNKPISDPTGSLYFGQCGSMVVVGNYLFAAHQSKGLLIIDTSTDKLVKTIAMDCVQDGAGIGSVISDGNGSVWASVTASTDGAGTPVNSLLKINASTFEITTVQLPGDVYGPATSWASWTPDTFCASASNNALFWTGGSSSWFANLKIYRYDIATGQARCIVDLADDEDYWKISCPSMRVDPVTGNIFASLSKDVSSTQYIVRSFTPEGVALRDYIMERGYWFPGMFLFPQAENTGVETVSLPDMADSIACRDGGVLVVNSSKNAALHIYDLNGRLMFTAMVKRGDNTILTGLSHGVYVAAINNSSVKLCIR